MDCTGDGDLAAQAGCGFDIGGVAPGQADQPASLIALVTVEDDTKVARFTVNHPTVFNAAGEAISNPKKELYNELTRVGLEPSYAAPTLFRIRRNLFALMANHEYGVRVDDADGVTVATVRARGEIFTLVDALAKKGGDVWRGLRIVVGTVPVFIVAGFIESFFTRHTEWPDLLRLSIILCSLAFVIYYYIVSYLTKNPQITWGFFNLILF